jgi:ATP-dependent DNA helicase RecG
MESKGPLGWGFKKFSAMIWEDLRRKGLNAKNSIIRSTGGLMEPQELRLMLTDLESDLIERKASLSDPDRIRQAICAFANDHPFDLHSVPSATIKYLDLDLFEREYLRLAIAPEVLAQNTRSMEDKLKALRFLAPDGEPTVLGMLVLGTEILHFIPGAYVQFLRLEGKELTDPIRDQKMIDGPLQQLLRRIDEVLEANNSVSTSLISEPLEIKRPEYPLPALQQLVRNAILHRTYEGTYSPVRIYWFSDRIEIHSPGGPFGQVTRENFGQPGVTDYRNPHLAEAMRVLGYVQRFGLGIQIARQQLAANGNPPPVFIVEQNHILATIRR